METRVSSTINAVLHSTMTHCDNRLPLKVQIRRDEGNRVSRTPQNIERQCITALALERRSGIMAVTESIVHPAVHGGLILLFRLWFFNDRRFSR